MKFFTIIFSIYILALSAIPCNDAHNDCKSNTEITDSSQSHNHRSDHNDGCSPFCACPCCGVSANLKFTPFSFKVATIIAVSKLTFPKRDFTFVSNYYGNIWQPPKINA